MRHDDPSTLTNRIIRACNVTRGLSLPEIYTKVGGDGPTACAIARLLVERGRLFRAGTRKLFRYFAQQAHAEAYEQVFKQERERIEEAKAIRKRQRQKATRKAQRRAAGLPTPCTTNRAQTQPKKTSQPRRQGHAGHGPALTVSKRKAKAPALESVAHATTVTWPAHVQVQRTPTPTDDRYTFTPPPGWVGEFGREWRKNRSRSHG
jgi:hypothetical protein